MALGQGILKIRTADFFFQLPEKPKVQRHALINGIFAREERGQCRAFIIRGASASIPIALFPKHEGILLPFRFLCGLHV